MEGKHLVYIAGGIGYVPLRSLINLTLKQPLEYDKISILYGTKTPEGQMYRHELAEIESLAALDNNIQLLKIVDLGESAGTPRCGLITELIPDSNFDPKNTKAFICGPPIMYKFAIMALKVLKLPPEDIFVSLERRMKCGVGKCGHCQINDSYVCQDGPVYRYSDIINKKEAL